VRAAAAEGVKSEHHVTVLGEPIGTTPDAVVLSCALVQQQHTWPDVITGVVVDGEVADHGPAEGFVLDALGVQHGPHCRYPSAIDSPANT
jgi:hypothetical protein